jgi:hypothetical protein
MQNNHEPQAVRYIEKFGRFLKGLVYLGAILFYFGLAVILFCKFGVLASFIIIGALGILFVVFILIYRFADWSPPKSKKYIAPDEERWLADSKTENELKDTPFIQDDQGPNNKITYH